MSKPRTFKLESVDQLLTPEQCVQWMQLPNQRALEARVKRGDIPAERFGERTTRFWPRRILLSNGAPAKILHGPAPKPV